MNMIKRNPYIFWHNDSIIVHVFLCSLIITEYSLRVTGQLSLIPRIFFPKKLSFYTIRSIYLCNANCMLNLTCNFNLITKICDVFLAAAIFKSLLSKMAATVISVEFGTIHHYSWRKILKLVFTVLWTDTKINWTLGKLWHFGVE